MKIRSKIAAAATSGIMAAGALAAFAPQAHATTTSQTVNATIGSSVAMTTTTSDVTTASPWVLAATGANSMSGGSATVTSNSPYTLSVSADKASMSEWDNTLGTPAYVASGKALTSPLTITAANTGGTGVAAAAVTGVSTLLGTGVGLGSDSYSLTFSQPTTVADSALATGHYYHIVLTYTASSTL